MASSYVPDRGDYIWLDFEPSTGKEIGKYRPAFVLSSKLMNSRTGLIICCPISTSIRGGSTELPIEGLEKPSVIATNLIYTFSWKERRAKFIKKSEAHVLKEVLYKLLPLIGAAEIL